MGKKKEKSMKVFEYSKIADPTYFKDGCIQAHSDHVAYATEQEYEEKVTSFRKSLNGSWNFYLDCSIVSFFFSNRIAEAFVLYLFFYFCPLCFLYFC